MYISTVFNFIYYTYTVCTGFFKDLKKRSRFPSGVLLFLSLKNHLRIVSDLRPPGTRARARTSRGIPQRALRPDLPAVYLEAFHVEFNSNILRSEYCSSCNRIFSAGDLRVGFMMEPIFRAQWLHIACIRRARLQSVGRLLCYDPSVTLADRETALKELGRSGRNSRDIQPWNYLRAFVHQWNTEVVHQSLSNDDPTIEHLERDIAEILNSLPCSQLQTSQDICAICHQIMAEGEMVCNLPCGHFYHVGCIDAWLRIRTTCPLDNRQIFEKAKMSGLTWEIHGNKVEGLVVKYLRFCFQTCFKN